MTPESLIATIAEAATTRISRRVIRDLQKMRELQSGDDSILENVWDEICVQIQGEYSVLWPFYDETVRTLVRSHVNQASDAEVHAIWLQTDEGTDWLWDTDCMDEEIPCCEDDVMEYIMERVYSAAVNWSNRRITAYLEKGCEIDI